MLLRTFLLIVAISIFLSSKSQSQEKIHLHFDKGTYVPGEIIYFKAYLLYNNQPSFLSTNFYVAAYTDDGKLLQQKQYPIFESTCIGDFSLPDSINDRTIRIRAFTKGLQIADTTYFYEHTLHILQQQVAQKIKNTVAKINLQFFGVNLSECRLFGYYKKLHWLLVSCTMPRFLPSLELACIEIVRPAPASRVSQLGRKASATPSLS